jgi:hypothetical protein
LPCSTTFTASDGTWTDLMSSVTTVVLAYNHTVTTKFLPGNYNNYRVRAMNGVGWGPYSDTLNVLTPIAPTFMNLPTAVSIDPKAIVISWTPLDNST